ncbi:MAG: hypothetical protein M1823_003288 [Watsoniomyces obsoletus]|nr:MAG: hypothetical protein M1823_003288 [Watsoniomyces obsoletus]
MGKGTDKLYITHSEWASEDAYSASVGAGASSKAKAAGASFKRLPFHFCALSLQPFKHPVCTSTGTVFELTNILPWIKKHGTNPVDGSPLKTSELLKLHVHKNEEGEYIDPVTFKVLTDNTHIVAIRTTGNVFAYETVERLNIKAKMWRDLVTDEEFSRKDLITLQDPLNVSGRDLNSFQYLNTKEGLEREKKVEGVNASALGSSAKILKATEAVTKARQERTDPNRNPALSGSKAGGTGSNNSLMVARGGNGSPPPLSSTARIIPYNAAQHTTGKAAASFTSTGLTPHTSGERALLTDEEYMLKPRRVKNKGYARIQTNKGDLNIELQTEYAPKAVWNFVQLAKKGYYRGVRFHRNIRNFMIQGGDPTGTGKGGNSIWNRNFTDEFDGPLTHDSRGVMSMANKGKNTNSSQFFITYRPTKHLDKKHTIFGKIVEGDTSTTETLSRLESTPVDSSDRPTEEIFIEDILVYLDPFEEFQKEQKQKVDAEKEEEEVRKMGGREDEKMTWTGKRVRGGVVNKPGYGGGGGGEEGGNSGVGKYLKANLAGVGNTTTKQKKKDEGGGEEEEEDEILEEIPWDEPEPVSKKVKIGHAAGGGGGGGGGFGNFDNW